MEQKKIITNATVAITQVIITGALLFFLYRYLIDTLGIEQLGVWSVVLATTSMSRISELGFSNSVIKFVSKYLARNEILNAAKAIETAVISIFIFIGAILCLAYFPVTKLLAYILPEESIDLALSILPYAFISLWINAITGIILSGLDGMQRIDLRGLLIIIGNIIYFTLAMLFIPTYGLIGLALAQLAQSLFTILAAVVLLHREMPEFPIIPHQWSKSLFKEMIRYGINFQIASLMTMLFEPTTKALLSKFGSLSIVGYFEMANRMVMQFRSLLVSANQVLVPVISSNHEIEPDRNKAIYKNSYDLTLYLSIAFYGAILSMLPIVSEIWIGRYEVLFIIFSSISVFGWFINTLSTPAFFGNLGSGNLRWNTISSIITAVLNCFLGIFLGSVYAGIGVAVAWMLSLSIASCLIIVAYKREQCISLKNIFPKTNIALSMASISGVLICWYIYYQHTLETTLGMAVLSISIYTVIITIPFLLHPMLIKIKSWVLNK